MKIENDKWQALLDNIEAERKKTVQALGFFAAFSLALIVAMPYIVDIFLNVSGASASHGGTMGDVVGGATIVGMVCLYFLGTFLPVIVAYNRNHRNTLPILVLSIFLGWTCLGWIAAMIWAVTDNVRETRN